MNRRAERQRRSDFSSWLRTGRVPPVPAFDDIEYRYNPWHDPKDGRFTTAASGMRGAGHSAVPKTSKVGTVRRTLPADRAGSVARARRAERSNPAVAFAAGFGEGVYGVAKGTVTGAYTAATTNPVTTVRNYGLGLAHEIDMAIAAEDIPAHTQLSRAANGISHMSAREIGRATGSVAGNAALAIGPAAGIGRLSSLRALRQAELRPTYLPAEIGWAKETFKGKQPWIAYNDGAPGAVAGKRRR